MQGMNYAASLYWDEVPKGYAGIPWPAPPPATRVSGVMWNFDQERFKAMYLDLMTRAMRPR